LCGSSRTTLICSAPIAQAATLLPGAQTGALITLPTITSTMNATGTVPFPAPLGGGTRNVTFSSPTNLEFDVDTIETNNGNGFSQLTMTLSNGSFSDVSFDIKTVTGNATLTINSGAAGGSASRTITSNNDPFTFTTTNNIPVDQLVFTSN